MFSLRALLAGSHLKFQREDLGFGMWHVGLRVHGRP